jgi:hypothetical protein
MQINKRQQAKRGTVTEEIEKLKQRRDDRKDKKVNEEKKTADNGKCDAEYENLIKKKKIVFNQKPEQVSLLLTF